MQIRVSNDTVNDALPRISEAEIQVSRHRISAFLSTHTAYELLPESGKVWYPNLRSPSYLLLLKFRIAFIKNTNTVILIFSHLHEILISGYCARCWSTCKTSISYFAWAGMFGLYYFLSVLVILFMHLLVTLFSRFFSFLSPGIISIYM